MEVSGGSELRRINAVEETTKDTKTKAAMRPMGVERQPPNGDGMENVPALDSELGQTAVPFAYFVVPTETLRLRRNPKEARGCFSTRLPLAGIREKLTGMFRRETFSA
jgi:hypothetical protein